MIVETNVITPIIKENLTRTHLIITNMSDVTLYLAKDEYADTDYYENNGLPLKQYGLLEISGIDCYKGSFYAVVTGEADIRVMEL